MNDPIEAGARAIVESLPNDATFEMHQVWAVGYAAAAYAAMAPLIRAALLTELITAASTEIVAAKWQNEHYSALIIRTWIEDRAVADGGQG